MSFPRSIQDEDDLLADALARIDADYAPNEDRLRAELDAIGNEASAVPQTPEPVKPEPVGFGFQTPDFDDPDVIRDDVELTRYDKARKRLADLTAEREALPSGSSPTKRLTLDEKIKKAERALERSKGDVSRKQEGVDLWRKGVGREQRNAGRRARSEPNADLKDMTEEQKTRRHQDQKNDSKFVKRRRDAGMPEDQIQAELIIRIREREADRAAKAQEEADEATMRADPRRIF